MRFSVIIVALLLVSNAQAKTKKKYICHRSDSKVHIDGVASEKCWKNAEQVWFVANENEPLKERSWFKACWDANHLYFFCYMEDKDIIGHMIKRDDHLWHEEVIEIFLDADNNPKTYYEFEWNPLNTLLDLYVLNPNCTRDVIRQWWSWNCEGIKSFVKVDGTLNNATDNDKGWSVELAIPFSEIQSAKNIPP